nr:DNA internalization-related competence protein ComEC/Rec2 [Bordetella petrii]
MVQGMPALPQGPWGGTAAGACCCCAAVLAMARGRWPLARHVCAAILGLCLGAAVAILHAQARLRDGLDDRYHDAVTRLAVRVADLPSGDGGQWRFMADTGTARPVGVPRYIQVSWRGSPGARLPELIPGQRWRMALVLRHPHGARNPHGHDAEGRLFALGIRAVATVRGTPRLLDDDPWFDAGIAIQRIRHYVRRGMRDALGERRYAPVLVALAMGDQAGVARDDWRVFNRSGITHLVSISGMHVTLIAGLGGAWAAFAWRRARWRGVGLSETVPAQVAGAAAALCVALLYCLLAGWGVPARRTFFMLAVVAVAAMMRLPLSPSRILALAAAATTLLDPWATLAPGFWLSFGAVAILLRAAASTESARPPRRTGWSARLRALVAEFGRVQLAITLGLVPLLAFLMHQVSLASPLANAFAIPIVSFLVTPLALLCAALGAVPGMGPLASACGIVGHAIFEAMMVPVSWISAARWAVLDVAAAPWPLLLLAVAGVGWALQPPGWPARPAGWLMMLPMLCWSPARPAYGDWSLTALDVGQGGAVVVETATQAWLFDTGPRMGTAADAGASVIAPFLRARGHRRLHGLVVSHADMDHAGGLGSVLAALPVDAAYASFDLPTLAGKHAAAAGDGAAPRLPASSRRCHAGQAWRVDGVDFRFLHPHAADTGKGEGNMHSCVLLIQGANHTALLPGDIGAAQERRLASALPRLDLVMAPHHGSKTSSSAALVGAASMAQVVAQVGYLNRFGHPAEPVQNRWRQAGATFWRTDRHGAISVRSTLAGLAVRAEAYASRRYWHRAPAGPG